MLLLQLDIINPALAGGGDDEVLRGVRGEEEIERLGVAQQASRWKA